MLVTDTNKFPSRDAYNRKYCAGGYVPGGYGNNDRGASSEGDLHIWLIENFMVRRKKEDVFDQLPARNRETIYLSNKKLPESDNAFTMFSDCSRLKSSDANFLEWVANCIDQNAKVVLFCHFQPMMNSLKELCKVFDFKYTFIDGSVPVDERPIRIDSFQNDPSVRCIICSYGAGSDGINLSAADVTILADEFWNPEVIHQAENRTFDPGKLKDDTSYFPIAYDFEYVLQKMRLDKLVVTQQIHDGIRVSDFDSKKSMIELIAEKYSIKTGFELKKKKSEISKKVVDDNIAVQ